MNAIHRGSLQEAKELIRPPPIRPVAIDATEDFKKSLRESSGGLHEQLFPQAIIFVLYFRNYDSTPLPLSYDHLFYHQYQISRLVIIP